MSITNFSSNLVHPFKVDPRIRINSIGYLADLVKGASVAAKADSYQIRQYPGDGAVYSGRLSNQTGKIYQADFSDFNQTGHFYLDVAGVGKSAIFAINTDVYLFPLYTALKAMYLWRSGTAVSGIHQGITYSHPGGHQHDGYLDYITGSHTWKDGTGGWYDAGDYGKYVVNAAFTLGTLFCAWEHFKPALEKISLELPGAEQPLPDFLAEMKYETDWLLKMQYPDRSGRICHKLTTKDFPGFIMPQDDKAPAFFVPWSSPATADFAAACAMAARIFKPFNPEYSRQCLEAAETSYRFLLSYHEYHPADQAGFSTGRYENKQYQDIYDRLWAAAELWETTGNPAYKADFENRARQFEPKIDVLFDWAAMKNLGMFTYLRSAQPGKDANLEKAIKADLLQAAESIVKTAEADTHKRPLGNVYYWGSNGLVARQTMLLQIANREAPDTRFIQTALHALDHLFGRNVYCRSFVTGLGYNPPLHPHDRRSAADKIKEPWPGYLVGGGTKESNWKDNKLSFMTNEIAINWNSALIYALAGFVK